MYFVVTLALKMLIYALVNSAFSGVASLKLHLFIHSLRLWGDWLSYFLVSPFDFFYQHRTSILQQVEDKLKTLMSLVVRVGDI